MKELAFAAFSAAVVLSGCGLAQAVRDSEVQMARDKCTSYGIAAGSPQMAQCVMENAQALEAQRVRNFQAGQAANARLGTSGVGAGMAMEPAPAVVFERNTSNTTSTTNIINMSPPPTMHCTQTANAGVCTSN